MLTRCLDKCLAMSMTCCCPSLPVLEAIGCFPSSGSKPRNALPKLCSPFRKWGERLEAPLAPLPHLRRKNERRGLWPWRSEAFEASRLFVFVAPFAVLGIPKIMWVKGAPLLLLHLPSLLLLFRPSLLGRSSLQPWSTCWKYALEAIIFPCIHG